MALVGYARVSTRHQHPQAQTDALTAAGRVKAQVERAWDADHARRRVVFNV